VLLQSFDLFSVCSECVFFLYFSSIIHLNGKLFISCRLYLLYPSVIEFIFFIVNKQTTSIPRTFEKLATPLVFRVVIVLSKIKKEKNTGNKSKLCSNTLSSMH